jgi:hypothetical protein
MTKQFIITFEFDERTRWVCTDEQMKNTIKALARSAVDMGTEGTRPAVRVGELIQPRH